MFLTKWWKEDIKGKLAVIFLVYVVIGFPSLLFTGASIFGNTSVAEAPIVGLFFILLFGPVFALPTGIFVLELRQWFIKRSLSKTAH